MIVQRSVVLLLLMMFVWVGCGEDKEEVELSVEDLIIQLGDLDSYVALKASEKLIEMGEPAVPELIKVLTLPNMGGRQKLALQALQKIGAPSVQKLIPLLENPLVSSQVAEVLFAIGTSEALQAVDEYLSQITWEKDDAKMVLIPAGSFEMGDHFNEPENWMKDARPVHTVELDAFYMDIYEVTVGQFKKFVKLTNYDYAGDWQDVAKYSPADDHPMVYVNWGDAYAYAKWAGKRLPTEAEWEYAARGGLIGKRYPWGDDESVAGDYAHYSSWNDGKGITKFVGSLKPNGYGLYDMAGNVWEWCPDWYDEDYYGYSPLSNPQGPVSGSRRVFRGGSWNTFVIGDLRVARRLSNTSPDHRNYIIGFRCVSESLVQQ